MVMEKALIRHPLIPVETPGLGLSAAQADVWNAQRLATSDNLYNIGGYVEFRDALKRDVFHAALLRALTEADSYRFNFLETEHGPRQVPTHVSRVDIPLVDFSGGEDPRAAAAAWMHAEADRPFDLSAGPAYRFALLGIGAGRIQWFCVAHHLVTDMSGLSLLVRRVAELYNAAICDTAPPAVAMTPWSEVLEDEREYYASARSSSDRDYWRKQLLDRPELVSLCGDAFGWPAMAVGSSGVLPRSLVARLED